MKTIILGTAHLKSTPGKCSPDGKFKEYLYSREICKAVKAILEDLGYKVLIDIEEEDFYSAEIEVVPAGRARDFGLDRSMIMAYGQDDKVCAYTSLMAMMEIENPAKTAICILFCPSSVQKYEIYVILHS